VNHRTVANARRLRAPAILTAASALLLAVTACSSATPTPIVIYTTPTPAPTGTPTPVVTPTPTAKPTASPTNTPAASATPTAVPSPTPPSSPSASPSPGPAAGCSGKAANLPFWVDTANHVPFTVYCGVVPSPWYFNGAGSNYGNTGNVTAEYKTSAGADFKIAEGTFTASAHGASLGSANFGDQTGTLYAGTSGGYVLLVSPGTAHAYQAVGLSVTQSTMTSLSAALIKVPKS
jgi:hypothetical protein